MSITVLNGVIDSAAYINTGQTVDPALYPNFRTVNQLFDLIQSAIVQGAFSLSVNYHPTLGYPSMIDIDYEENLADIAENWAIRSVPIFIFSVCCRQ